MTTNAAQGVSPDPLLPPPEDVPITDRSWTQWFYQLYQSCFADGMTAPKMGIQGRERVIRFSPENVYQDLVTIDGGLYSNYTSSNGNIIYGFACNVKRSGGKAFTVGQQINAWGDWQAGDSIFAQALTAVGMPRFNFPLIGSESMVLNCTNDNRNAKWAYNAVFGDRFNQAPTPVLGNNRFNYFSVGMLLSSQSRSATGERCGWTRGWAAYGEAFDSQVAPAWNAALIYSEGMVVTSGGLCYQCIAVNVNQVPAAISIYWVQHTAAGTAALAIGIDFSATPTATMARMSSAMRLRDTMKIEWEVTGAVSTYFRPTTGRMVFVDNAGTRWLEVDVANGFLYRNNVFLI